MSNAVKRFTIIAGPNGSGKTTFVLKIFPDLFEGQKFVNADIFAKDLNAENVEKAAISAGKKLFREIDRLILTGENFVTETTLSGSSLLKIIKNAQDYGYVVKLIFLWLTSSELSDFRVKGRVVLGGHSIPVEDIGRRYKRGLNNFPKYYQACDECEVYIADEFPQLIFTKDSSGVENIDNPGLYDVFNAECVRVFD